jgi:hypothetical protein
MRTVHTFDGIVDVLGGLKAVAKLQGVEQPMVRAWRRAGQFPARTMERIVAELARRGVNAPRYLWDFDPPRTYDDEPKRAAKRA